MQAKSTTAEKAQQEASLRGLAVKTTAFTRLTVYDFADGSFLVVHANGRTEINKVSV